jgi:hypothetical protein
VRAAAAARGHLSDDEVAEFATRDVAFGRICREPWRGRVSGIEPNGALLIETPAGMQRLLGGSLVLEEVI